MDIDLIEELNDLSLLGITSNVKESTQTFKIVAVCGGPNIGVQKLRDLILKEIEAGNKFEIVEINTPEDSLGKLANNLPSITIECIDYNTTKEYYNKLERSLSDFSLEKAIVEDNLIRADGECTQYFRPIKSITYKSANIVKPHKFKIRNNC